MAFSHEVLCGLSEISHERERVSVQCLGKQELVEALGKLFQVLMSYFINNFMYPVVCVPTLPTVKNGETSPNSCSINIATIKENIRMP